MADLGEYGIAVDVEKAIRTIVRSEIDKQRPKDRQAEVMSINLQAKTCQVIFVGETDLVTVPFTTTAPSAVGQFVSIGGTTHDRHIVDVLGTSRVENELRPVIAVMKSSDGSSSASKFDFEVKELVQGIDVTTNQAEITIIRDGYYRMMFKIYTNSTESIGYMYIRKMIPDPSGTGTTDMILDEVQDKLSVRGGGGEGGTNAKGDKPLILISDGVYPLVAGDRVWCHYQGTSTQPRGCVAIITRVGQLL